MTEPQSHDAELVVTQCVCYDTLFTEMLEHMERNGGRAAWTLERLQQEFRCGTGCGLCVPYVRKMLATGRPAFAIREASANG